MTEPKKPSSREGLRSWHAGLREDSSLIGLGMQLAGTVVFFVGGGVALDLWLDTMPWLTITGALLGMVALFYLLLRVTREMSAQSERERRMKNTSTPGSDLSKKRPE